MAERQAQTVKLPSLGKFYGDKLENGEIEVYPIRVLEEKLMAGSRGSGSDRMNLLIAKCLKTAIDPKELLMVDRMFLLYFLSLISYGADRKVKLACPSEDCGDQFDTVVNFEQFDTKYADEGIDEPYFVKLPVSGDEVGLRFLRGSDEAEIANMAIALRRRIGGKGVGKIKDPGDMAVLTLVMPVVSVNGEELTTDQKITWAEDLLGRDADFLRDAMSQYDFGVDLSITASCPTCGKDFSAPLPAEGLFRFL